VNDVIADLWGLLSIMVGSGVDGVLDGGFYHNLEHHACSHIQKLQQKSVLLCLPSQGMLGYLTLVIRHHLRICHQKQDENKVLAMNLLDTNFKFICFGRQSVFRVF